MESMGASDSLPKSCVSPPGQPCLRVRFTIAQLPLISGAPSFESRPHADRVAKISIIPRGVAALGYTQQQPTEDRYLLTEVELLDRLDVMLGGRVAEELVFGDIYRRAR